MSAADVDPRAEGPMDPGGVWRQVLGELALQMTRPTFETWLAGSQVVGWDEEANAWEIGVRHAYGVDWLEHRLKGLIERTVARVTGRPAAVRFVAGARLEYEPARDGGETLLEAVQERRVAIQGDGSTLVWTDFYIKLKVAFRRRALRRLKGAKLAVWLCLALHVDRYGVSSPGIEQIMQETGYTSRSTVCSALEDLVRLRLIEKMDAERWGRDRYRMLGYAWFGQEPAPALFEVGS